MVFPLKPPFSYGNPQLLIAIESQPPCYPETSGVFQTKQRQQLPRRHGSGQVDVVVHLHDLARVKNRGIAGEQKDTHVFMEYPHLYMLYIWIILVLYRLYMAYNILIYYIGYIYIYEFITDPIRGMHIPRDILRLGLAHWMMMR